MTDYEKLTAELDDILAKAQPVDGDADADKKIAAAADDAGEGGDGDGEGEGEGEEFMKSFGVTLENGEQVEAYDATALLKAMHAQNRQQARTIASLKEQVAGQDAVIQKVPSLLKAIQTQMAQHGELLKALREQPSGRKSVAAAPAAAEPAKPTRGEIMTKALGAQQAGRLSVNDVAIIEARLNNGVALAPHHLAALEG